ARDLRRQQVPPVAARPVVVRDVARRLLQVAREATPLQHLAEELRRLLAREVDSAELRDRVVSVLHEDALVERLRLPDVYVGDVLRRRGGDLFRELVEEQPPERLPRAGVAREQRALDDLREVHQREDGVVERREVPTEELPLLRRELLRHERKRHPATGSAGRSASGPRSRRRSRCFPPAPACRRRATVTRRGRHVDTARRTAYCRSARTP